MRFSFLCMSCTVFLWVGCRFQKAVVEDYPRADKVYSRQLDFPSPSYAIEAQFDSPVLRWPPVKGKAPLFYDLQLSDNPAFSGTKTFTAADIPWAMYNPHLKLEKGDWYWRYRVSGGVWSDISHFRITDRSLPLVSPSSADLLAGVPAGHPRVLAGNAVVTRLRALSGNADKDAVVEGAAKALVAGIPSEEDGFSSRAGGDKEQQRKFSQDASKKLGDMAYGIAAPLCQAYLLTGSGVYRQKAVALAMEVSRWDPEGVSATSDFGDARCMLAMALVYDTFHDTLDETEKKLLRKAIHARASEFYAAWVHNMEARLLSGHVWQHILHYFFQTAIAVYGEEPEAGTWLTYAYELFLARTPLLGGTDGGWAEGASYFRMNMETLIEIPLFIKEYTGFDFIETHPWYRQQVYWLIYHVPPGSAADGFGDNTEEVLLPGAEYLAYATEIAKLCRSRPASWYVAECRRYEDIDLSRNPMLRWVRLARTGDIKMPDADGKPDLPTGKLFSEAGLVSFHSDPGDTKNNLSVAMRSSPFGSYGHTLSDQNTFNILYGGQKTFFRTGYKVTMKDPHRTGWYQHTRSNNGILIDGNGQPYSAEAYGWISRFAEGEEIGYARGDASNAYASEETGEDHGVRKFYRHLVFLKPDIVLLYDELEADRDAKWSWLIHSMERIEVDTAGNSFRSSFEKTEGRGYLWASTRVQWALADTFDVKAVNWRGSRDGSGQLRTYDDRQWHLKATNSSGASAMRFFTILKLSAAGASGKEAGPAARELQPDGTLKIAVGKWKLEANIDLRLPPGIVITDTTGASALATHGGRIRMGGNSYASKVPDGTILVEKINGKTAVSEYADLLPASLRQRVLFLRREK